jgi:uncharacterized membrane protein
MWPAVLVVALGCWVGLLVASPVALASTHRAVLVGAALAYSGGSYVCHQQAVRSFAIAGRQMPVCARCTGLYASALAGGLVGLLRARRRVGRRARWLLAVAALPTAISWTAEQAGAVHPSNAARALLALPLGLAAGWLVIALLREPPTGSGLESRAGGQV